MPRHVSTRELPSPAKLATQLERSDVGIGPLAAPRSNRTRRRRRALNATEVLQRWRQRARSGHCGATTAENYDRFTCGHSDRPSDSAFGWPTAPTSGSFGWRGGGLVGWDDAAAWCSVQCSLCPRCRYISVSLQLRDCSWYSVPCDRPQVRPSGFLSGWPLDVTTHARALRPITARWETNASRVARDRLLLSAAADTAAAVDAAEPPEWVQPRAEMSVGVVFFGKVGGRRRSATDLTFASARASADPEGGGELLRLAHASFEAHVVAPNPRVRLSVFAHSWNPPLGAAIDALHARHAPGRLVWSAHEDAEAVAPPLASSVHSALESLRRCLAAKRRHERAVLGRRYDLVALLRHDLVFRAPLVWARLPRAQLWLPRSCCSLTAPREGAASVADTATLRVLARAKRRCGGGPGSGVVLDHCRVSRLQWQLDALPHPEAEHNYYVGDWLLVAPSATADTFGAIAPRLAAYTAALDELSIRVRWMHFYLAAHIHDALRATAGLRSIPLPDLTLARWAPDSPPLRCGFNRSFETQLPPPPPLMYTGMRNLCSAPMRGLAHCDCPPAPPAAPRPWDLRGRRARAG